MWVAVAWAGRVGDLPSHPSWRWQTIWTEHVAVHYPTSRRADDPVAAADTAQRVVQLAEALWPALVQATGHRPRTVVHIVLRDDGDALVGHAVPAWNQVVLSVHPGADLARARGRTDVLASVLAHELGHVFTQAAATAWAQPATLGPGAGGWAAVGGSFAVGGQVTLAGTPPSGWSEGAAELASAAAGVATWTEERDAVLRMAALDDRLPNWARLQLVPVGDLWGAGERQYQAAFAWGLAQPDAWPAVGRVAGVRYAWDPSATARRAWGVPPAVAWDRWRLAWVERAQAVAAEVDAAGRVDGALLEGLPAGDAPAAQVWWPRLSPDGRWSADQRGAWIGVGPEGGAGRTWLPATPGGGFAWSPDGGRFVYAATHRPGRPEPRHGYARLFAWTPGTSARTARPIPNTWRASAPAVSPDGAWLAWLQFRDGTHAVWIARLDGSEARALTGPPGARLSGLSWALDGGSLATAAWASGSQDVWSIPADGRPATRLARTASAEDDPAYAPDGSLLYTADVDGRRDVFRRTPEGAVLRVTRVVGAAATPSVDPDGALRFSRLEGAGWLPARLPASSWVNAPEPSRELAVRAAADAAPVAPAPVVPYRPLAAVMPWTLTPFVRVESPPYPTADLPMTPRLGAWLQAADAVEDHALDLVGMVGADALLGATWTWRGAGPEIALDLSQAARWGTPTVSARRGALSIDHTWVGPLRSRVAVGAYRWDDGVLPLSGARGSAEVGLAHRVAALSVSGGGGTPGWWAGADGALRWFADGDDRAPTLALGGSWTAADRPLPGPLRLAAGGDHPFAWYPVALETSSFFPGFAPYALAGEARALAHGAAQISLWEDGAARLGPWIATEVAVAGGADVGDVWAYGARPQLRGDVWADLRWRAVLTGAPWDGLVRVAWAPGEPVRGYLSLGSGW